MSGEEGSRCHREGRGEMKFEVFQEIEDRKKKIEKNSSLDEASKKLQFKVLEKLEESIQKL